MNVSNLSSFNLLLLRSNCGEFLPCFGLTHASPLMRPLRLIVVSFPPVNVIDDFGILGASSNSILPWEFTYQQFETDTNWSFFCWRRQSHVLLPNFKLYYERKFGHKLSLFFVFLKPSKHFLDPLKVILWQNRELVDLHLPFKWNAIKTVEPTQTVLLACFLKKVIGIKK